MKVNHYEKIVAIIVLLKVANCVTEIVGWNSESEQDELKNKSFFYLQS